MAAILHNFIICLCAFNTMSSPYNTSTLHLLPTEELPLFVPSLQQVAQIIQEGLQDNFENVEVSEVDCPDLTQEPFLLAGKGLNGCPTIIEVGSESYLIPVPKREKIYDLKDIARISRVNPAFIVGAGAGPYPYVGVSSEFIPNVFIKDGDVLNSLSQIAKVVEGREGKTFVTQTLPSDESTFALMSNLFVSEGKPGKVLKINCTKRIGENDFPTAVRESLNKGFPGKSVGLGGAFLITKSKVRQHVQPDFSKIPLDTPEKINNWLQFYNMNPPLVALGTLITKDPGLNLRLFHFHSLSDHREAGHYHYDLEPDTVQYLAYFNVGERIVRVDKPS